jgi:hypothetical protein
MLALAGMGSAADRGERAKVDTGPVLKMLRAEIAAKPSRVLIAVEDALTMNEAAACEIVREAIISTRADAKLTGEIVFTALTCAPAMSAAIVECATRTSPHAVEEIRAAVQRALGERAAPAPGPNENRGNTPEAAEKPLVTSGKGAAGPDTAMPSAPEEIGESFDLSMIGVGGIYLLTPARAMPPFCAPADPCCNGELTPACLRP